MRGFANLRRQFSSVSKLWDCDFRKTSVMDKWSGNYLLATQDERCKALLDICQTPLSKENQSSLHKLLCETHQSLKLAMTIREDILSK